MVTVEQVAAMAAALPQTTEGVRHGHRTWDVAGKTFAWERPFSKADLKRFGEQVPPDGPILAVRVADLEEKEEVLALHPDALFTISHFDGYAAVLIQLDVIDEAELDDVLVDGWSACAPDTIRAQLAPDPVPDPEP